MYQQIIKNESGLAPDAVTALPGSTAAAMVFRARGQLHVTVIAKATFGLAADQAMSRVAPQEILRADAYHRLTSARSVQFASDLAPRLGRADVVFTGCAHAPPGGPLARSLRVRLALHDGQSYLLDKSLLVKDDRGFQRMPIVYDRAASGEGGKENPFGIPPAEGAPNIVDPQGPARPAGFGPIGRAWPARRRLLGALQRKALEGAIAEIPDDFDWTYFQSAPLDQRVDHLRGDEWIILEGMHPVHQRLCARLPGARGLAQIHGLARSGIAEGQPLELCADTLRIDGDEERCTVVWRQSFPVPSEDALSRVRVVAGVEVAGEPPLVWSLPQAGPLPAESSRAAAAPAQTAPVVMTLMLTGEEEPPRPALPYEPASAHEPVLDVSRPVAVFDRSGAMATLALSPGDEEIAVSRPAVPFPNAAAPAPPRVRAIDAKESSPALSLLWSEPLLSSRLRRQPAWRALLDTVAEESVYSSSDRAARPEDPDAVAAADRRAVWRALAHGEPLDPSGLAAAHEAALREDGGAVAPVVLLAGDVSFCFDAVEALRATVSILSPHTRAEPEIEQALAAARDFLRTADLFSARSVAGELAAALRNTYSSHDRAVPMSHLAAQIERALIEHRCYQRRAVFGGGHLRCLFHPAGAEAPVPVYMAEALASELPMLPRLPVRFFAELHPAVDREDVHPAALRVTALARR